MFQKTRVAFLNLALVVMTLTAVSQQAEAHAALVSSSPTAGATVAALQEIVLTFNEPVRVLQGKLTDLRGNATSDLPAPKIEGAVLHYAIAKPLPPGGYEISYRVMTPDHHVAGGTLAFTVSP